MPKQVRFHFDPLCPWAWQTSVWMREVSLVRDIEIDWRLFSLMLANDSESDPLADVHARGTSALRTMALVRQEHGNEALGRLYEAMGTRRHEQDQPLDDALVRAALGDCGLDEKLLDRALEDEATMDTIRTEHQAAVDEVGAFGVPMIVLESGRGMFGPVIATAARGEAAGELWDRVEWLIELDGFYELKRDRDRGPGETAAQ